MNYPTPPAASLVVKCDAAILLHPVSSSSILLQPLFNVSASAASCTCHLQANSNSNVCQGAQNSGPFWEIYGLYNIHDLSFKGIYWGVMPRQIPTALALFFVVAFGSSLDVAAIQQDSPEPLDYNRELVTVGECMLWLCASGVAQVMAQTACYCG